MRRYIAFNRKEAREIQDLLAWIEYENEKLTPTEEAIRERLEQFLTTPERLNQEI